MFRHFAYKAVAASVLLSLCSAASALGDQWYVGIGGGISRLQPNPDDSSIGLDDEYGRVGSLFIGRDFDDRSSGQLQLYSLGEATFDDDQSAATYLAGDASLLYRFFDTRDYQPRGTLFGASLYGRFGFGFLQRDSDLPLSNDTPVYFGAGAGIETYLTRNLGIRLETLYQETDAATATLSLVGRFGGRLRPAPIRRPAPVPPATPAAPQASLDMGPTSADSSTGTGIPPQATSLPETFDPSLLPPSVEPPPVEPPPVVPSTDLPVATAPTGTIEGSAGAPIELTPLYETDPAQEQIAPVDVAPAESAQAPQPADSTAGDAIDRAADDLIPDVEIMTGAQETVSEVTGAPAAVDSDADEVPDSRDQCPESTPGYPVTDNGCAMFGGLEPDLVFVGRSAELMPGAYQALDRIAIALKLHPAARIELVAHTDQTGSEEAQSALTRQRLRAIGSYLVKRGIDKDRLLLRSFGGKRPAYNNSTAIGRFGNNRVEVFENP